MIDFATPENLWTLTNLSIQAVVVVSGLVIARDVAKAFAYQFGAEAKTDRARVYDDHTFLVPELGLTMADGGERTDQPAEPVKPAKPAPKAEN